MTFGTGDPNDFALFSSGGRISRQVSLQAFVSPACLVFSVIAGAWLLYARLDPLPAASHSKTNETPAVARSQTPAQDAMDTRVFGALLDYSPYGSLLDPGFSLNSAPVSLALSPPLEAGFNSIPSALHGTITEAENVMPAPAPTAPQLFQNVPVPMPRPAELQAANEVQPKVPARQMAQQNRSIVATTEPSDNRSFFDKIFGKLQPPGPLLAYANPEDGAVRSSPSVAPQPIPAIVHDRLTAVYDISARTVYMPNGTKLEAHSGLGDRLDDPRYVSERMRGPTPPHVYELTLREQLFHGVQALRLNPVGEGDLYGRTGLLAHRYMLGPNGDSNGCVSFKDYNAFLQAYLNGEVKRLVVVARLN